MGLAGAAFIPWLGIRMSPWLTYVNLSVAAGLVLASLGLPAAASLRVAVAHHLARLARAIGGLPVGPSHFAHSVRGAVSTDSIGGLRRLIPSISVGVATLALGLVILASGDALLASFFDIGDLVGTAATRVLAAASGVVAFAVMTGAIHVPGASDDAPRGASAPALPTLFGIGGLAIAIGAYAATQISAAVLGADFVKDRTGLTYAEYARSGFFQMVAVTVVAAAALGVARSALRASPTAARRIRIGAAILTVGVVVTVVSAVVKLVVYADTFGLTMLRVYTVVFACWLGLLALLSFAALLRGAASWFAPVVLGSICVGAFAMNLANPERIVAAHNLDRAESTGKLDVGYLSRLSLDAAPTILDRLDDVDAVYEDPDRRGAGEYDARALLTTRWCHLLLDDLLGDDMLGDRPGRPGNGGLSFNAARGDAIDSASEHCS